MSIGNARKPRLLTRAVLALALLASLATAGVATATPTTVDDAVAYGMNARHDGFLDSPSFGPSLDQRWSRDLGDGVSSPLIAGGRVYVTARGSSGFGLILSALDDATGETVWSRTVGGTYSWAGMAYEAGRLFVVNFDGLMQAIDAGTGAPLWTIQLPGQYAFSSAPTAVDGIVYVGGAGSGGTLYAVTAATGHVRWTRSVMNGDDSSPAVVGDEVVVSYACRNVYAFDRITGAPLWTSFGPCEGGGGATPVVHDGRVYVRDIMGNAVLDASTGGTVDTFAASASPAFAGDVGVALVNGDVNAFSTVTGVSRWTAHDASPFTTSPVIVGATAYVGDAAGVVHAIDVASGQEVGTTSVGSPIAGGDQGSSMAAGEGLLVVAAGSRLVALGSPTYDPAEGDAPSPPLVEPPPEDQQPPTDPPVVSPPTAPPVVSPPITTPGPAIVPLPVLTPTAVPVATPDTQTGAVVQPPAPASLPSAAAPAPRATSSPRRKVRTIALSDERRSVVLHGSAGRVLAVYRRSGRTTGSARVVFYVGSARGPLGRVAVRALHTAGAVRSASASLRTRAGVTRLLACIHGGAGAPAGCGAATLVLTQAARTGPRSAG